LVLAADFNDLAIDFHVLRPPAARRIDLSDYAMDELKK
jgi:hypothetical protein